MSDICKNCKYAKIIMGYTKQGMKPMTVCTANEQIEVLIDDLREFEGFTECQDYEPNENSEEKVNIKFREIDILKLLTQVSLKNKENE